MKRNRRSTKNLPLEVNENLTRLGEFLRWGRKSRNISIREMAVRLMVSPATVVNIEKGAPSTSVGTIFRAIYLLGLGQRFAHIMDPAFDSTGLRNMKALMEGKRVRKSVKHSDWGDLDF